MLHYVGLQAASLSAQPPDADAAQSREWAVATQGVTGLPGFYRLLLGGGQVSLTLCLGDPHASLAQLALQADAVFLGFQVSQGPTLAALARYCKRGTTVHFTQSLRATADVDSGLRALGFQPCAVLPPLSPAVTPYPSASTAEWVFDPTWAVRRSRQKALPPWPQPQRCTVIGAGVSGASVARALALRGWKVQVLDVQDDPASGASGVPAGLVSPTFSADDAPMAQLTRAGCALMRQHVQALLVQGRDWAPSGAWLRPVPEHPAQAAREARHIPEAFWLQPAAMVRAWLATPGVTFTGRARVNKLERLGEHWVCLDKDGLELARSELVVVANALDAARLLGQPDPTMPGPEPAPTPTPALTRALAGLHPRYGAVSMGASAGLEGLPARPVQGHGNFLPSVPTAQRTIWLAGAGFDSDAAPDPQVHHHANLARLKRLLPDVAATLAPQFEAEEVQLWQGQRCVSHDRLPLVGPVQAAPDASLWISAAMGARGLTLAALCAELLAARIGGEPLPLPARLARLLDVQRAPRQSLIR
jgi:tRNA 5-methylaminomethyl-2-thiouridine biosynthesis bifunctional protein